MKFPKTKHEKSIWVQKELKENDTRMTKEKISVLKTSQASG